MIGIYARVSTEEQANSGFSIQFQLREGKKKAGTDDVKSYIDEGISGEILDRPALTQLRKDIREGLITKVVCLDPDRLSRKLMNQLIITDEFDKRGVEIVFVNGEYAKTPEGTLFYSMRGAIAEFEKAKINERMSRGRKEKAIQGRVLRDFQIYGYSYDKETEQITINETEAQIVRLIFDLFTKPNTLVKGINGIAKYLTDRRVPTKRNAGIWHRQVVRQILMNRAYIGEFYQNRWNTEGMLANKHKDPEDRIPMRLRPKDEWIKLPCPDLVSEMQFELAQKLLSESKRRHAKESVRQYLLSGLLRCGDCGNTMTGRRSKNWGKYVYEYTDRKNTAGAKFPGCPRAVNCEELDNEVWNTVLAWLNNPNEIAAALEEDQPSNDNSFEQAEILRLQKELEKTKTGRKKLLKLFADDVADIGEEELRESLRELKEKEEHLTEQLNQLLDVSKGTESAEFSLNLMKEAAEFYLTKNPDELTFEDKKQLIRQVVKEIRVFANHIEVYSF